MDLVGHLDLEKRVQSMDDETLKHFGKAAKERCMRESQYGRPPFQESVTILEHARVEWRRRHPDAIISDSF